MLARSTSPGQCHCLPRCQRWEQGNKSLSVKQLEDGVGLAPHQTSLDLNISTSRFFMQVPHKYLCIEQAAPRGLSESPITTVDLGSASVGNYCARTQASAALQKGCCCKPRITACAVLHSKSS